MVIKTNTTDQLKSLAAPLNTLLFGGLPCYLQGTD